MRIIQLLILFIGSCFTVYGQDIQKTLTNVDAYNQKNPQEKIYLHLDKSNYTAGETIWFKAYTTIGIQNLLSNVSGIGYVELISPTEQVVSSIKIPLTNGIGLGDMTLNDTIVEGSYRLRAYTNWMRNQDDRYFYDRTIQISNGRTDKVLTSTSVTTTEKDHIYAIQLKSVAGIPLSKTTVRFEIISEGKSVDRGRETTDDAGLLQVKIDKKHKDPLLRLQFENQEKGRVTKLIKGDLPGLKNSVQIFPEGGKLLANSVNVIGVKAVQPNGLGVKAKVVVLAGKDTVAVVETNALGMGSSSIFVQDQDSLQAFAEFADGAKIAVAVPAAQQSGHSLVVNNANANKLYAQLNISNDLLDKKEVYFVVQHLGQVFFVSKQTRSKNELVFSVDKKSLPAGVVTVSILNSEFLPVIERAVFNYNTTSSLPIVTTLDKSSYGKREKVNVKLAIGDATDSMRFAALSASVLDLSKVNKEDLDKAPNILSGLLLSADLKGFIEHPGYYFESEEKTKEVDFLMLTQGWRNIDWLNLDTAQNVEFKAEKSLKISGYTKKLGRKAAEPGAKVQLISTKSLMDFIDTVSAEDGYFEFDNLLFPDSVKFLITAKNAKGKNNIDIAIQESAKAVAGLNRNAALERWDINSFFKDDMTNAQRYFSQLESTGLMERAIAIEEVVVRATKKKVSEHSRNLNGPGNADQIITAEELSTCPSLDMCLAGRLTGVTFVGGVPHNTRGNAPMQVVLDGMFIEGDQLSMINVSDIESVEVLRNVNYLAVYGSNGANGLIILTSKTGTSAMRSFTPKGIVTVQPKGIHVNKTFYKPQYDVAESIKLNQDLRTTIHWEPALVANAEGQANFDFYSSDAVGKYLMVIEGIDLLGRVGRKVIEVEVK